MITPKAYKMEQNEFEKLEALLKDKQYDALDDADKSWVTANIGDQKSYTHLYELVHRLESEPSLAPNKRVKADLMAAYTSNHQTMLGKLLSYRMPAVAGLCVLLCMGVGIWYLAPAREVVVEKMVPIEKVTVDTLLVELPKDTVYILKTVRVEVPVYVPEPKKDIIIVKGSTLSEQKDLQGLLVRGEDI